MTTMRLFIALSFILPLALTGHLSPHPKYSIWMLESIISRGEGISAADGLLGEIQKVCNRLVSYQSPISPVIGAVLTTQKRGSFKKPFVRR